MHEQAKPPVSGQTPEAKQRVRLTQYAKAAG